jgi:protein O-mannosyl-transferase
VGIKNNRQFFLLGGILLAAVTATYSNHFHNSFHFDDAHTIVNNIYIKNIGNIPLFFRDGTTISSLPTNQSYRPLVAASLALDYRLGQGTADTFYFHLSMFVFFLLQGLLMYFLYCRIFATSLAHDWIPYAAFLGVAWYLLHPANAETINYIIARSDSLSALFIIGALVMYTGSSICRGYHLYLLPVALGCLTKPVAAVFAPLLLFYILFFEEQLSLTAIFSRANRAETFNAVKKSLPALLCCLFMLVFVRKMDPPTWTPGGTSLFHYIITQPYVVFHYFTTFFLPLRLSADTDLQPFNSILEPGFAVGILFVAGLILTAVWTSRRRELRPIAFGIVWFLITLLPTSLIPLAEVMNDHRLFLPFAGLMAAVCWALFLMIIRIRKLIRRERLFVTVIFFIIGLMLTVLAHGTFERNKVWKNEETLWHDVTMKSPKNGRGLMNYGLSQMAKGDYARAEDYFTRALEFTPNYPSLHINLGIVKNATGRTAEAESCFTRAIALGPGYPECYFYYGRFLKDRGRLPEAIRNLETTLQLAAAHVMARHLLMDIFFSQPDTGRLKMLAEQTAAIVPNDPKAAIYLEAIERDRTKFELAWHDAASQKSPEAFLNLSLDYYRAGDFEKSIATAEESLKLRPDYDLAYNNICAAYNGLRQWDKAIEAGTKAVHLNPDNRIAHNNLAWARQQKAQQDINRK